MQVNDTLPKWLTLNDVQLLGCWHQLLQLCMDFGIICCRYLWRYWHFEV